MPLGMVKMWLISDWILTNIRYLTKYISKYMEKSKHPGTVDPLIVIQGLTWRWFPQTVVGIAYTPVKE